MSILWFVKNFLSSKNLQTPDVILFSSSSFPMEESLIWEKAPRYLNLREFLSFMVVISTMPVFLFSIGRVIEQIDSGGRMNGIFCGIWPSFQLKINVSVFDRFM